MSGHTPGPWHVENLDEICTDASGACVAMVNCCGFGEYTSEEEHAANARLIAAAPFLLDSILDALACLTAPEGHEQNGVEALAAIPAAYAILREALAVATDGAPS
jgi:hypothetical protein